MSIKKLKNIVASAISEMENGKTLPIEIFQIRLQKAFDRGTSNPIVGTAKDVINKMASKKDNLSQREFTEIINKLASFGDIEGFKSEFKDLCLPTKMAYHTGAKTRLPETEIGSLVEKTDIVNAFAHVFDLKSPNEISKQSSNVGEKAVKLVKAELKSLGLFPVKISAIKQIDSFILCKASFKNEDFTTSDVLIPVELKNDIPALPEAIISNGTAIPITKLNVLAEIKASSQFKKISSNLEFENQRNNSAVNINNAPVPSALKDVINSEDILFAVANHMSQTELAEAIKVISKEISCFGIGSPQLKFASAEMKGNSKIATFKTNVITTNGKSEINIPIEIKAGKYLIPSKFKSGNKEYDFSKKSFLSFLSDISDVKTASFERVSDDLYKLSYPQLMNVVWQAVNAGDDKLVDDSMSTIANKFDQELVRKAYSDYAVFLKSKATSVSQDIIKNAFAKGYLVNRPNYSEPFCPQLAKPLSQISFDENGKPIPKYRNMLKYDLE